MFQDYYTWPSSQVLRPYTHIHAYINYLLYTYSYTYAYVMYAVFTR